MAANVNFQDLAPGGEEIREISVAQKTEAETVKARANELFKGTFQ